MPIEKYERNYHINFSIFKYLLIVYCLFIAIPFIKSECQKDKPIYKDNTCKLE